MGKRARRSGRDDRARRLRVQIGAAEAVRAAWDHAWLEYMRAVTVFTREHLAVDGRRVVAVGLTVDDHHDARQLALDGGIGRRVSWPSFTYLPKAVACSWLARQCQWALRADVIDQMMPTAQFGAGLAGFDAAPVVARFDPDVAAAVMATPITGDLPVELLHRLPAWTVAIPVTWTPAPIVVFASIDTDRTELDGVVAGGGPDQLLITLVTPTDVAPTPINLDGASIAIQIRRHAFGANPEPGRTRFESLEVETVPERFGLDVPLVTFLEQIVALLLYLCSEEPDVAAVTAPRTSTTARRGQAGTVASTVEGRLRLLEVRSCVSSSRFG